MTDPDAARKVTAGTGLAWSMGWDSCRTSASACGEDWAGRRTSASAAESSVAPGAFLRGDWNPDFVIAAGGGLSWIKIDGTFEVHNFILVGDQYIQTIDRRVPESEWLFGGQIFTDLTFTYHWLQLGINAKYQMTQEMKSEGENFDVNNYRLGAQIGVLF